MTFDQYLQSIRPAISVKQIEKIAGLPHNQLLRHLLWLDGKDTGRKMPDLSAAPIIRALCGIFGVVKIKDYEIYIEPEASVFIVKRRERTVSGTKTPNLYRIEEYRQVFDDMDLVIVFLPRLDL